MQARGRACGAGLVGAAEMSDGLRADACPPQRDEEVALWLVERDYRQESRDPQSDSTAWPEWYADRDNAVVYDGLSAFQTELKDPRIDAI